jgi:hypothetical protein
MTRFDPSPARLRALGFVTLASILGLGLLVTRIPEWQEPEMGRWTATIPIEDGARGLEPGGQVLVGGYPRGRIISVDVLPDVFDRRGRPLVGIDFELPSGIELGRDAVVRRSVGIAGSNGVLDIPNPGSRDRLFDDATPRVIAIDTSPPAGGPIGVLIGRRNGERIEAIANAGDRFGAMLPRRLRGLTDAARRLTDDVDGTRADVVEGFDRGTERVRTLAIRFAALGDRALGLPPIIESFKRDLGVLVQGIESDIAAWRPTIDRILANTSQAEQDVAATMRGIDELMPTLRSAEEGLDSAMLDARAANLRLQSLAPEVGDGLRRTMARMVLAGGQLRLALNDLLPLALKAITVSPDRRSLSRRQLLESVNDTVNAISDVRDAARRLDVLAGIADEMPSGAPAFDRNVASELETRVAELERLLDALAIRLQDEIRADESR